MKTSIIAGQHLEDGKWLISLILHKSGSHAYIVIEGFDDDNSRVTLESHYGYQQSDSNSASIVIRNINYIKLKNIASKCKMDYWLVNTQIKDQLVNSIKTDMRQLLRNPQPYVLMGKSKLAGSLGTSMDTLKSTESKKSMIRKVNKKLQMENNSSRYSIFHTAKASLQSGDNCISWAKKKLISVLGDQYKETALEKLEGLVVVDPKAHFRKLRCNIL